VRHTQLEPFHVVAVGLIEKKKDKIYRGLRKDYKPNTKA
jgi:hypothetical protein